MNAKKKELNFMVHCGGTEVERTKLAEVPVPETTRTYNPIPFDQFTDLIEHTLKSQNFQLGQQIFALSKENQRMFGMAELLCNVGNAIYATVCGWRSSYDKSFPASFTVGSHVFVCDNLAFCGEIVIARRNTQKIMRDLPGLIMEAVSQVSTMQAGMETRYGMYQDKTLKDALANHLIIEMLKRGIINTQRVEKVVNEYYEPSHEEFNEKGKSDWTLFNAATETLKGVGLYRLPQATTALHGLCDEVVEYQQAA